MNQLIKNGEINISRIFRNISGIFWIGLEFFLPAEFTSNHALYTVGNICKHFIAGSLLDIRTLYSSQQDMLSFHYCRIYQFLNVFPSFHLKIAKNFLKKIYQKQEKQEFS